MTYLLDGHRCTHHVDKLEKRLAVPHTVRQADKEDKVRLAVRSVRKRDHRDAEQYSVGVVRGGNRLRQAVGLQVVDHPDVGLACLAVLHGLRDRRDDQVVVDDTLHVHMLIVDDGCLAVFGYESAGQPRIRGENLSTPQASGRGHIRFIHARNIQFWFD